MGRPCLVSSAAGQMGKIGPRQLPLFHGWRCRCASWAAMTSGLDYQGNRTSQRNGERSKRKTGGSRLGNMYCTYSYLPPRHNPSLVGSPSLLGSSPHITHPPACGKGGRDGAPCHAHVPCRNDMGPGIGRWWLQCETEWGLERTGPIRQLRGVFCWLWTSTGLTARSPGQTDGW